MLAAVDGDLAPLLLESLFDEDEDDESLLPEDSDLDSDFESDLESLFDALSAFEPASLFFRPPPPLRLSFL